MHFEQFLLTYFLCLSLLREKARGIYINLDIVQIGIEDEDVGLVDMFRKGLIRVFANTGRGHSDGANEGSCQTWTGS